MTIFVLSIFPSVNSFIHILLACSKLHLNSAANSLLDKDLQEPAAEIQMAAELIDNYLLDKRFMRELEDRDEYDAA